MSLVVLVAYAIGVGIGLLASRIDAFGRVWPVIVRTQLLIVAVALSITAVWSITSFDSVLWAGLAVVALGIMTIVTRLTTKGPEREQHAALQVWSAAANTGFWMIPIGTALWGPAGATFGVLMDRMATPLFGYWTHVIRRHAPVRQRRRTTFIDQSPTIALAVGVALRVTGPAPDWAHTITYIAAPVLAASGAAVFVGSILHPSQRIDPRPGLRRWVALASLRAVLFLLIAVFAPTPAIRVVAILGGLSIPVFGAPQMAAVYGYSDPTVAAGTRYGWFFGAAGLALAVAVTYWLA